MNLTPEPSREFRRTTFGPRQRRIARALAEAFFTEDEPLDPARLEAFVSDVDDHLSRASKTLRFGLARMLDLLSILPAFVLFRFTTFDELDVEERVTMLERMDRSRFTPLTLVVVAYKTLMTMCWFEAPDMLSRTGYPGDLDRKRHRLPAAPPSEAS